MIQLRSMLNVADNSGAKVIQCIQALGGTGRRYSRIGDIIVAVVIVAEPRKLVKTHQVIRAVIVRQRQAFGRKDGSYIRFDDNAAVVLEGTTKEPKGTRVLGPVARELKEAGYDKIATMAPELL
jgi:large subunit ribosomal protein L14